MMLFAMLARGWALITIEVTESGVVLEFWTNIDLSIFEKVYLLVEKPNGEIVRWDMNVSSKNSSVATRVVAPGDFDEEGIYKFQLIAESENTYERWISNIKKIYVYPILGGGT